MNTLDAIRTRRSVRKYAAGRKPVAPETVRILLEAAMAAPSAGNQQPWHFVVVDDPAILDQIPAIHPFAQMAREAPLAVLVCGDTSLEKHKGYWVQDCAAAVENLLLAAHDQGLGAVWTGLFPKEERIAPFRSLFGLPDTVFPLALVVVGHPGENPPPVSRFREDRIRRNHW